MAKTKAKGEKEGREKGLSTPEGRHLLCSLLAGFFTSTLPLSQHAITCYLLPTYYLFITSTTIHFILCSSPLTELSSRVHPPSSVRHSLPTLHPSDQPRGYSHLVRLSAIQIAPDAGDVPVLHKSQPTLSLPQSSWKSRIGAGRAFVHGQTPGPQSAVLLPIVRVARVQPSLASHHIGGCSSPCA